MAESQNIEWKESWRDEYLKWICGFANAQGGKIYIGTRDDGTVIGVKDSKKLLEDIPNKIQTTLGIVADVDLLTDGDKNEYIEISVKPSSFPVNYKGEYHYRSGSTKQQLRGIALTDFLSEKTGMRWEDVPVPEVSVDDLDKDSFDIFRREALHNALIHSCWFSGAPVQIRIEDDAMYISNDCVFPSDWTAETLMRRHRSRPYNPSIANAFFRAGYVESWGRGIQKICESCESYGTAQPEYVIHSEDIMVKLPALSKILNRQSGGLDGGLADKIIAKLKENPKITQKELADNTDISLRTIQRTLKELRENGVIERKGSKRFGYWEVND